MTTGRQQHTDNERRNKTSKKFVSMCRVMLMAFNLFSSAAAYDIHGIQDNSAVKEIAEIMMDEDAFVQSLNEVAVQMFVRYLHGH